MLSMVPKTPPETSETPAAAGPHGDLRSAARHPASVLPAITGLRISPHGVEATLVNISSTGVLAECGERLKPGSAVTVVFEGTFVPRSMEGRVARNSVSSMGRDGRLRYHVGIAFARTIDLGVPDPEPVPEPAPEPAPHAHPEANPEPKLHAVPPAGESLAALFEQPPAAPAQSRAALAAEPEGVEFDVALPAGDEIVRNRW
jgi:PilZ domain-containing protein